MLDARARLRARHPERVGDRAHQDVGVAELGLEQDPEAVEEGEEPEARPDPAQVLGLVGARGEALQVGAVRDDRRWPGSRSGTCRGSRRAPRPRSGRRGRSAATRASARGSRRGREDLAHVRERDLVAADGAGDGAHQRAHAEALVAHPVGDGEVADAARAGGGGERADAGPSRWAAAGRRSGRTRGTSAPSAANGTKATLTSDQEQEDHAQHRPGEVLEHPLDGAAEGEDQHHARGSAPMAIQPCVAWSGAPGIRPIQAPSSVAAALPARAGQPSWKKPSTV